MEVEVADGVGHVSWNTVLCWWVYIYGCMASTMPGRKDFLDSRTAAQSYPSE